jgi:hypothetical protein
VKELRGIIESLLAVFIFVIVTPECWVGLFLLALVFHHNK